MNDDIKSHNDALMKVGYQILHKCKDENVNCMIWGGGAIYHLLEGQLDYRKMSDIEFLLPKKGDKQVQSMLQELDFIPYTSFNNMQNMYSMPRREYYRPNRELTVTEIDSLKGGRKKDIKDVKFQKIELFIDGIRMCWSFKMKDLPKDYVDSFICPPGFQIALKSNPVHPDDFDLKDIQDIANILNGSRCTLAEKDTIFTEPGLSENMEYCIGSEIFEKLSKTKNKFPGVVIRNLSEVLKYDGLTEEGKLKINTLIDLLTPIKEKDESSRLASLRKERPVRVDSRTR